MERKIKNNNNNNDVKLIKQIPMVTKKIFKKYRRARAAKKIIIIKKAQKQHEDYDEFINKVPLYTTLKRKIKSQDKSAKKPKNEENDVEFIKQVPSHPCDKLK